MIFFGFDFQTISINHETFGAISCMSYTSVEFSDIFGLKYILIDMPNILNVYQVILAHKKDEMRFLIFIVVELIKV